MTRALVLLVLLTLVPPLFARTEVPVAPLAFGAVATDTRPAIATDGEVYFAVWRDGRDGVTEATYGARIDANGQVLDPIGVRLLEYAGNLAIAFGDGRYLVVNSLLDFAIVDRTASVVARGRISEEPGAIVQVVFNGSGFVVFWGYDNVRAATVDRDGRVGEITTVVATGAGTTLHDVATNGARIVALYVRGLELHAALTSMSGAPISDSVIAPSVWPHGFASIAEANDEFVATWVPLDSSDLAAARLDANGALVQGPVIVAAGGNPEVVATGGAYRLFTLEGDYGATRLVGRSLGNDLSVGVPVTLFERLPRTVDFFAAAAGPGGTLAVADLGHKTIPALDDGVWSVDGDAVSAPHVVSRAAHAQLEPSIAVGDEGTFVAWQEQASVRATFFPHAGAPEHVRCWRRQ